MNREKSREAISTKQLFTIIVTLLVGRGLLILPSFVTKEARQDGWISTLLAGMICLILMNMILFALKFFNGKSFIEISEIAFGKYLGKMPGVFLIANYTIFSALAIRTLVDLTDTWLLPRTPIEILTISVLALCYYLCRNGVKILGRFDEALFWIVSPIFPFFFIPFFIHRDMLLLLPVGGAGLSNIIRASIPALYAFLGFESILLLYPYAFENASHQEIVRSCNQAMIFALVLKVFIVFSSIAVFGDLEIHFFLYPVLEYFKLVSFPVVERVEFALVYFWLFILLGAIFGLFKLATLGIGRLGKINGYKNIALLLAIPVYFLTKVPQNVSDVFRTIELFSTVSFFGIQILVFLVFIVAFIRKRRASS